MTNIISVSVKGTPDYITVCNSVAVSAAGVAGLDIEATDDVGMAVIEGCKIISCHDSDCWCNEYVMEIKITEKEFCISISATGEYELEKCRRICEQCPQEGDLGMAVMNTVMDRVLLELDENNKKRLVMAKTIQP